MTVGTTDRLEHAIGQSGEFSLRFAAGRVAISGMAGETARIRDTEGGDLASRFTIDARDGVLDIREKDTLFGFRRGGRDGVGLEVEVPRAARVVIETASADIRAEGLAGEQRYRTASGELALREIAGKVGLDTVSGDVEADIAGDTELEARLVSGDLVVTGGSLTSFVAQTTSGDVRVDSALPGPGPYSLRTVSGDAQLVTGDNLRIESATVTGGIFTKRAHHGEIGPGRRVIEIGDGAGTVLAFQSISGDLTVDAPVARQLSAAPEAGSGPAHRPVASTPTDSLEDQRLAILHDLEAGHIDVAEATARLALIEGAD